MVEMPPKGTVIGDISVTLHLGTGPVCVSRLTRGRPVHIGDDLKVFFEEVARAINEVIVDYVGG